MKINSSTVTIVGAGPVGTLLSIYLCRLGHKVAVYEKRQDPRSALKAEGRSINIALSHRGLRALEEAGIEKQVKDIAIPMKGRMIHNEDLSQSFQPYGEEGQMIYSISRNELNKLLINEAERNHGVQFHFETHCDEINHDKNEITFSNFSTKISVTPEVCIGADGAFSEVRKSFSVFNDFNVQLQHLSHGYKELNLPAGIKGEHKMEQNALHIWPRGQFMLIALPNCDGTFTCTLFLPQEGAHSFKEMNSREQVEKFFKTHFQDVLPLMPNYLDEYFTNPTSSLTTIQCFPWHYNNYLLIGDAAHAITPFYGQGMNAGFEDCRILHQILQQNNSGEIQTIFQTFQKSRKANADAIATLALQNFIEMRDLVGDKRFLLRKKIEGVIHSKIPSYLPLYTMVTFSDLPYSEALQKGNEHDRMMEEVMAIDDIETTYSTEEGWRKIDMIIKKYL